MLFHSSWSRVVMALCAATLLLSGCFSTHENMKRDPRVIDSGWVGKTLVTTEPLTLTRCRGLDYGGFEPAWSEVGHPHKAVGPVPAGTRIVIDRVEAKVFHPLQDKQVSAVGRIEDGPMAGKLVALEWRWSPPGVSSPFVTPRVPGSWDERERKKAAEPFLRCGWERG